jgi:hypothetical protein
VRSSSIDGGSVDHLNGLNLSLDFKDEETSRDSDEGNLSARSSTQLKSDVGLVKTDSEDLSNAERQACLGPENSSQRHDENMYVENQVNLFKGFPVNHVNNSITCHV